MFTHHVTDQLTPYLDGHIEPAAKQAIARHLERCHRCRTELETVRRGMALASELLPEPMPSADAAAVARTIEHGDAGLTRDLAIGRWRWGFAASAALFAIASALAIYVQLHRPWVQAHAADARPFSFEHESRDIHGHVRLAEPRPAWKMLVAGTSAFVSSYRIDGKPVTLVTAPRKQVIDAPSAGWIAKRVEHRLTPEGWHTLSWSSGGETYVLVSELDGLGQRACLICHADERFRGPIDAMSLQ